MTTLTHALITPPIYLGTGVGVVPGVRGVGGFSGVGGGLGF
jgi:hypothetical protein